MRPPVALAYASGLAITSLSRLGLARHAVFNEQQAIAGLTSSTDSFDWTTIEPSQTLQYTPCYDGLQCARLAVPLNWNSSNRISEEWIAIAIAKLPAKVPVTDSRYGGAVLINPGGPGESGVDQAVQRGRHIQTIVDAAEPLDQNSGKFFDILGFDPRGVKSSTPRLKCFSDAFVQRMWHLSYQDYSTLWEADSSLGIEWARLEALGHSCESNGDSQNIIRYVNTAQVVEDMVEILERHGQWRQAEAQRLLPEGDPSLKQLRWRSGKETIQYWGTSYGTLLGQTFAAAHPNRVRRLVIDGVLDPYDYYNGTWLANLQDSDQIMRKLCEYCYEAGPASCPMFTGTSAKAVQRRVENLVFDFKNDPLPVMESDIRQGPLIVSFSDVYLHAIGALAFPFARAENFFQLLSELEQGNTTRIAAQKAGQIDVTVSLAACRMESESTDGCFPKQYFGLLSSTPVIECMDSAHSEARALTKEAFKAYYKQLQKQSEWYAAAWARHRLSCIGMQDKPAWTYQGPISADKTSHPMLIVGNSHDSVTPLRNAHHVSSLFPGSVVLQQDSEGHCSHAVPSLCTARYIRQYFQTGRLPDTGSVCQPSYKPFLGSSDEVRNLIADDDRLYKSLVELAKPLS